MLRAILLLLALCFGLPARAQTPAAPAAPAAPAITQSQAQQTLDVLKDDKKRAQLIDTLETIAKAAPAPAKPAAPVLPVPIEPGSLGAQALLGMEGFFEHLSVQSRAVFAAMLRAPDVWRGATAIVADPAERAQLLDALWRLAAVMAAGLAIEWALARAFQGPEQRLSRYAPAGRAPIQDAPVHGAEPADDESDQDGRSEQGEEEEAVARAERGETEPPHRVRATAWTFLRRLPFALARLVLDLLPVLGFVIVAHVLVGTDLGGPELERLVLLAIVYAYAVSRALISLGRMMLSPGNVRLRLLAISEAAADYLMVWLRRIVVVSVFGYALASAGLLLGMSQEAHDAALKAVGLAVHLMLIVVVLQKRAAVARRLRARPGARGFIANLRNGLAAVWHWVALFYLVASWLVWAVEVPNGFSRLLRFIGETVGVLVFGRLALIVVLGLLDRSVRAAPELAITNPALGARLRAYRPVLRTGFTALVYLLTALALFQIWGFGSFAWFATTAGERTLSTLGDLGLTLLIAFVVWEAANASIEGHLSRLDTDQQAARSARLRTLLPLLRTTLSIAILVIVGLTVLSEIGINIAPLLAGAGVVGIAVGFGSQKLVQDVITGLFLLLENAMQVGDVVNVAGLSGVVEHLSIRSIKLRAEDGSVHVIPFSAVTTVTNMTRDFGYAVIEACVAYKDDYDEVVSVLREIVVEMRNEPRWASEIRDDLEVWGIDKFADSSVVIKVRIRCGPFGRWAVAREFRRRMKVHFDEHGIEIPSPSQRLIIDQPLTFGAPQPAQAAGERRAAE